MLILATGGCFYGLVFGALRDGCTRSFDRKPSSVATSYLMAFADGNLAVVERCWVKYEYYALEAGCSEICIGRNIGAEFTIAEIQLGPAVEVGSSREQMEVSVRVTCPSGGIEEGRVTLDSVHADFPWKHWKLIQSTVGGSITEPWCRN